MNGQSYAKERDSHGSKLSSLKPFDRDRYASLDLDRLAVYALYYVTQAGLEPSYENTTVASFKMFPEKFSLEGFLQYPDAGRVHECLVLHGIYGKNWIKGNKRHGFVLTDKGRQALEEAKAALEGASPARPTRKVEKEGVQRSAALAFVSHITKSVAFKKFQSGSMEISDYETCRMLNLNLDTEPRIRENALQRAFNYTHKLHREDILAFLDHIREAKKHLFVPTKKWRKSV